jgi:hypothetical protein
VITWANATSKKCIDLAAGNTTNGDEVELWDCNGLIQQQWIVDPAKGTIQLGVDSTKCLDNLGGSTAPGNRVGLWDCIPGDASQQWSYDDSAQTIILKENTTVGANSLCLDLPSADPSNGNWLEIWGCNGLVNQQWTMQKALPPLIPCHSPEKCPGGVPCPTSGACPPPSVPLQTDRQTDG